jgi:hypothetical protein
LREFERVLYSYFLRGAAQQCPEGFERLKTNAK